MGVTVLAAGDAGYVAGELAFDFGVPLIGLVCLIIGVWGRARNRRQPRLAYPPPGPPPWGYPGAGYPGPGYPPYPPPPRPTGNSGTALIIIGAVLLTFGIVGNVVRVAGDMAGKSLRGATDTSIQVGECITQKDYAAQLFSSRPANDCGNPANVDELAYKGGASATCPDGKREHSTYDHYSDGSTILCFSLNLKQGQCYRLEGDIQSPRVRLADCNDVAPGLIKVVQRIDGSTDKTRCPAETSGGSYPTPPVVYCLAKVSP
ncbi:LppU/SCO3897 family protein [Mycobacterium shigaense]|uniref:LppU/SCO3897 family protein n=1 Tax=Mycobacterium shigaense TaxID=722731 RepID=UPI002AE0593B|nr:hypothetical protein [Mycobacterium shigaense]MEA1122632.1 hypothetical protein [Mycobacterium shigaense]